MTMPKGMIADHWTWRDGKPHVTGWHMPKKRGKVEPEEAKPSGRGVVRVTLFERMAQAQGQHKEPVPASKNIGPPRKRLRIMDAAKPKRRKPEQGKLL